MNHKEAFAGILTLVLAKSEISFEDAVLLMKDSDPNTQTQTESANATTYVPARDKHTPTPRAAVRGTISTPHKKKCFRFTETGECKYGSECYFQHDFPAREKYKKKAKENKCKQCKQKGHFSKHCDKKNVSRAEHANVMKEAKKKWKKEKKEKEKYKKKYTDYKKKQGRYKKKEKAQVVKHASSSSSNDGSDSEEDSSESDSESGWGLVTSVDEVGTTTDGEIGIEVPLCVSRTLEICDQEKEENSGANLIFRDFTFSANRIAGLFSSAKVDQKNFPKNEVRKKTSGGPAQSAIEDADGNLPHFSFLTLPQNVFLRLCAKLLALIFITCIVAVFPNSCINTSIFLFIMICIWKAGIFGWSILMFFFYDPPIGFLTEKLPLRWLSTLNGACWWSPHGSKLRSLGEGLRAFYTATTRIIVVLCKYAPKLVVVTALYIVFFHPTLLHTSTSSDSEYCMVAGLDSKGPVYVMDSACTTHIVNDLTLLIPGTTYNSNSTVKGFKGGKAVGCIRGTAVVHTKHATILLHNALYVPESKHNLFSTSVSDLEGKEFRQGQGHYDMYDGGELVARGRLGSDRLYRLKDKGSKATSLVVATGAKGASRLDDDDKIYTGCKFCEGRPDSQGGPEQDPEWVLNVQHAAGSVGESEKVVVEWVGDSSDGDRGESDGLGSKRSWLVSKCSENSSYYHTTRLTHTTTHDNICTNNNNYACLSRTLPPTHTGIDTGSRSRESPEARRQPGLSSAKVSKDKVNLEKDSKGFEKNVGDPKRGGRGKSLFLRKEKQVRYSGLSVLRLLHNRFAHLNERYIKKMFSAFMPKGGWGSLGNCPSCIFAKANRRPFESGPTPERVLEPGEKISSDLCGPMPVEATGRERYVCLFMDEKSRVTFAQFLRQKSQTEGKVKDLVAFLETHKGKTPKFFHTDGGGEYKSIPLKNFLLSKGIVHTMTAPHQPNQNSIVERKNRAVEEAANSSLYEAGLPKRFWKQAVGNCIYVQNRVPHKSLDMKCPLDVWEGKVKPLGERTKYIRTFGCEAFVHVPKESRKKLGSRARRAVYLGVSPNKKCWQFWDLDARKIIDGRDAIFNEGIYPWRVQTLNDNPLFLQKGEQHISEGDGASTWLSFGSPGVQGPTNTHTHTNNSNNSSSSSSSSVNSYRSEVNEEKRDSTAHGTSRDVVTSSSGSSKESASDRKTLSRDYSGRSRSSSSHKGSLASTDSLDTMPGVERVEYKEGSIYVTPVAPLGPQGQGEPVYTNNPPIAHTSTTVGPSPPQSPLPVLRRSSRNREPSSQAVRNELSQPHRVRGNPRDYAMNTSSGIVNPESNLMFHPDRVPLPTKYDTDIALNVTEKVTADGHKVPGTRKQAKNHVLWPEFRVAEKKEVDQLFQRGTFKVVPKQNQTKPAIPLMFVYDIKLDKHNRAKRYKARCVALGNRCKPGVDFTETHSPTAQMRTFRCFLALAARDNLNVSAFDVTGAYLYGDLKETVFVQYPPGYKGEPGTILQCMKGLYGLPQAGRLWNKTMTDRFKKYGLKQSLSEPCVWVHPKKKLVISTHVDDILVASASQADTRHFFDFLAKKFDITNEGGISMYLGIEVTKGEGCVKISQGAYIRRMLERYNMTNCNPAKTPAVANKQLSREDCPVTDEEKDDMAKVPFRSLVGSLLYAALGTRPDIANAVRAVARYSHNPGRKHWKAAQMILRYLARDPDAGIQYRETGNTEPVYYTDSDWGQSEDDRKSVSGYIWLLAGAPVAWQSRTQKSVSQSSCEAEFIALSEAVREVRWMSQFLEELRFPAKQPITVFIDNEAARRLAEDPVSHQRNKHIDITYFSLREQVGNGLVKLVHVPSVDNIADIFTKPTAVKLFLALVSKIITNSVRGALERVPT